MPELLPRVVQGPVWLVDLLIGPPLWLRAGFKGVVVVSLLLAVRGLSLRGWRLDDATQRAMLANAVVAVSVMVVTTAAVWNLHQPYLVDVALGAGLGFAGAQLSVRLARRLAGFAAGGVQDGAAFAAAWVLVAGGAWVPPVLAGPGAMPFVSRAGVVLSGVAAVLAVVNCGLMGGQLVGEKTVA